MMKLELRNDFRYDDNGTEYIYPLEEITPVHGTLQSIPTEQGELLLRFIREHLVK